MKVTDYIRRYLSDVIKTQTKECKKKSKKPNVMFMCYYSNHHLLKKNYIFKPEFYVIKVNKII